MSTVVPFTEARRRLTELLDELNRVHQHVLITRNGKPAAVLLSPQEYAVLQDTIETLGDERALKALTRSDADVAAGRVKPLDEVRRNLGDG